MPYSTEAELLDYAAARGYEIQNTLPLSLLVRAHDYLETLSYKGEKTDPYQDLQFPRKDLIDGGTPVDEHTIPNRIKKAECQMALEIDKGLDPFEPVTPRKTKISLGRGEIEEQYSYSPTDPLVTQIRSVMPIIRPFLVSSGGLMVVRS